MQIDNPYACFLDFAIAFCRTRAGFYNLLFDRYRDQLSAGLIGHISMCV